tara:strand:+ start:18096 stop:18251 length:156 start_codon:yes stop_codon:yes gene_type:complete
MSTPDSGKLERRAGLEITQSDSAVLLCGNHQMIADMQALLAQRSLRKHFAP